MAGGLQQLLRAIAQDDGASVKRLLSFHPALVHGRLPRDGTSPLHAAAGAGSLPLLRELLHAGASCQAVDANLDTPLHVACRQGRAAIVRELLADAGRRSCLRALNRAGSTPLHVAVQAGQADVAGLLLNAGARADARDRAGCTPLDYASPEQPELIEVLSTGRQLTPSRTPSAKHAHHQAARSKALTSPTSPSSHAYVTRHGPTARSPKQAPLSPSSAAKRDQGGQGAAGQAGADSPPRQAQASVAQADAAPAQQAAAAPPPDDRGQQDSAGQPQRFDPDGQEALPACRQSWISLRAEHSGAGSGQPPEQAQPTHSASASLLPRSSIDSLSQHYAQLQAATTACRQSLEQHQLAAAIQQQQQQQPQRPQQQAAPPLARPPASQLGPLHSARAAATHELGRPPLDPLASAMSCGALSSASAGAAPPSMAEQHGRPPSARHSSCGGGNAQGWIVTPEASSGLLGWGGPLHGGGSAASHASLTGGDSYSERLASHGGQQAPAQQPLRRGSHSSYCAPSAATAPPHQQRQLAGLAAAVACSGSTGPLQAPLQAQLSELGSKVTRLEGWFEAQVDLIPEWQRALEVVQALKRRVEEQDAKIAQLEAARAADAQALAQQGQSLCGLAEDGDAMRTCLTGFGEQMQQLQQLLVQQTEAEAARVATSDAQVSGLAARADASEARAAALEVGLAEAKAQLEQQAALEAGLAEVKAQLEQHAASARAAAALPPPEAPTKPHAETTRQLAEVKVKLAELSASVAGLTSASRVAAALPGARRADAGGPAAAEPPRSGEPACDTGAAAAGEPPSSPGGASDPAGAAPAAAGQDDGQAADAFEACWLPFMESTSACLAQHEAQLETLAGLAPKVEGVVALRAQMINVTQQLAALQTAFALLTGQPRGGAPSSPLLPSGPLATHKAAADQLAMATSMVKLQAQMTQLTAAVEGLQLEWGEAAASLRLQHEASRCAWEAEVGRLLTAQQHEAAQREAQLLHLNQAAAQADEAGRAAQADAQQRLEAQLAGLQAQQATLGERLGGVVASTEGLQAQLVQLAASTLQRVAAQLPLPGGAPAGEQPQRERAPSEGCTAPVVAAAGPPAAGDAAAPLAEPLEPVLPRLGPSFWADTPAVAGAAAAGSDSPVAAPARELAAGDGAAAAAAQPAAHEGSEASSAERGPTDTLALEQQLATPLAGRKKRARAGWLGQVLRPHAKQPGASSSSAAHRLFGRPRQHQAAQQAGGAGDDWPGLAAPAAPEAGPGAADSAGAPRAAVHTEAGRKWRLPQLRGGGKPAAAVQQA